MPKWATVTVTDDEGRRHSMDVQAESVYDAAHIFVSSAKSQQAATLAEATTRFEPWQQSLRLFAPARSTEWKGRSCRKGWIVSRREELKGPKGLLFNQRATLD